MALTVFFAACISLFAGDDLADVLDYEGALLDGLQGLDAPAAAVRRPVDAQLDLAAFLHDPVEALGAALTPLVAFEDRGA